MYYLYNGLYYETPVPNIIRYETTQKVEGLKEPRIDLSLLSYLSVYNSKKFIDHMVEEYRDWWIEIDKNKDLPQYKHIYRQYRVLFEKKSYSQQSNISDKFNELFLPEGLMKGELYTIIAPSGAGKTSYAIMLSACLISGNNPYLKSSESFGTKKVIYVSLEQNREQIESRFISSLSALNDLSEAVNYSDLINCNLDFNSKRLQVCHTLFEMYEENLKIVDLNEFEGAPTVNELFDKIKEVCNSLGDEDVVIVIDQYENIRGSLNGASDEVALEIKNFAQINSVPIILQAQINKKALDSAQDGKGGLSAEKLTGNSIRGSSGLEHQSTVVMILVPMNEKKMIFGHEAQLVKFKKTKARYGQKTELLMWFIGKYNLFFDYEKDDFENTVAENVKEVNL